MAKEIEQWYATHFVAPWQRANVAEIRRQHEEKQEALRIAHDNAASRVSDEYAAFELEYLKASDEFRNKKPDAELAFDGKKIQSLGGWIKDIFIRS